VPIEDDLRRAIHEGRVTADSHVVLVHPQDFNELVQTVTPLMSDADARRLTSNRPTYMGMEVRWDSNVTRGTVSFIQRSTLTMPVFDRENAMRTAGMFMPSVFTGQGSVFTGQGRLTPTERRALMDFGPMSEAKPEPEPKTLWEHLDEDEGD
jgi:hypothetical protein